MKNLYLMMLFLFGSSAMAVSDIDVVRIDTEVQKQIKSGAKLGVMIGIIKNGAVIYRSYGKTSLAAGKAPTKDDIFEIGSVTKVFNGVLLAQMHLQGRIDINDTISKFYPKIEWASAKSLTLKQLATHTAGLPGIFGGKWQKQFDSRNPFYNFDEFD